MYVSLIICFFPFISVNGDRQWLSCRNFTREETAKWLNLLRTQQRCHEGQRIRKLLKTDHPSIQGPWTPFTFRDPKWNLAKFPNEELSKPDNIGQSSQDELVELFRKQKLAEMENVRVTN
ncbi:hypothetical protein JTB14_025410 [Gonioctena quinquepunctata]|nr:hypothetical protein JTB14_025410 [Gonioctena quinquepunctata]